MISVVIVSHNSKACVGSCIDAVARWLPEAETLVIDNASTDTSRAVAEGHGARVIGLEKNLGFGRACNIGARRAGHEHILFLNPDVAICSADTECLRVLVEAGEMGLVVPSATRSRFMFTERSWLKETLTLVLRALRPRELPRRVPSPRAGRALWASGAALLVRRSEFLGIGGFDPRYFLYYEDRDLSWKYRQHDLPIRSTPALLADHAVGGSSKLSDRRSNVRAFAMIGWIQYRHAICGAEAAARTWIIGYQVHAVITFAVSWTARLARSRRLRRKSVQLREVKQELKRICASSGVLEQSDQHSYWPDAITVLRVTFKERSAPGSGGRGPLAPGYAEDPELGLRAGAHVRRP
jgi:N-acetylglucosaminyl-diphospho-decaprenol L-rhamnosyltransferase